MTGSLCLSGLFSARGAQLVIVSSYNIFFSILFLTDHVSQAELLKKFSSSNLCGDDAIPRPSMCVPTVVMPVSQFLILPRPLVPSTTGFFWLKEVLRSWCMSLD